MPSNPDWYFDPPDGDPECWQCGCEMKYRSYIIGGCEWECVNPECDQSPVYQGQDEE